MNSDLFNPIEFEKGVGPYRAKVLAKMGIRTPGELLFHFPRDYEDFSNFTDIRHLTDDRAWTICARVVGITFRRTFKGGNITTVSIEDGSFGLADMVFFNQGFRETQFTEGQIYLINGKPKAVKNRWQFPHPVLRMLTDEEVQAINESTLPGSKIGGDIPLDKLPTTAAFLGLQPVYRLTEGLHAWDMRRAMRHVLAKYADVVDEAFPEAFRQMHGLVGIADALRDIHFPPSEEKMQQARRRFVYQELFLLQLALGVRRRQQQVDFQAPVLEATSRVDKRIRALFPYDLTAGQLAAISDITRDVLSGKPMNRLLQGDVGCGKTTVAVYALLLAVAHGYQAAVMAPTEVLARQHVRTLSRMLEHARVTPVPLIGGMKPAMRKETLEKIASGEAKIIIGTQALLQDDVKFANLGMVVIDEQHKFGVEQRAALRKSGTSPHYLVMTATPIPRSVTMTLFGDLDRTEIRDLPPGRQRVRTYLASASQKEGWWKFFREQLSSGAQGYVVVPLIGDWKEPETPSADWDFQEETDEENASSIASLSQVFQELKEGPLAEVPLDFLHGRMSHEEKEAVMFRFRTGETRVLVSTSVIEVGVDIPNATLMTIESAERFGLAQLHQLRGRVSRGKKAGYCCVFASNEKPETLERLKKFTTTTDGFELAEIDFSLRGPGNLFGTAQHGLPPFRVADLLRDKAILEEARRDANAILSTDPGLANPDFRRIRRQMLKRYGQVLELGDVG
ncbi:MAG: ATP-dependent DNA helicase RecG [Planctomycetia bacterium]|nr:ATP-dependent DNA helicase RecG [Planctomycetia bacterium]